MSDLRRAIAEHRVAVLVVAGLLLVGLAVVIFWFEPQQLFIDDEVNEARPGSAAEGTAQNEDVQMEDDTSPATTSKTLAMGTFTALDHDAEGKALVLEVDGSRFLRFEDFKVENGPDLKVYLSNASAAADPSTFDDDFVDLGDLKGNIGSQNYKVPHGVDLSEYRSAVVWCRRFSVGFAVADLAM